MTDSYTLYYWPIPFRGHFIRYVLAEAGVSWHEADPGETLDLIRRPVAEQPYPFLAPPLLHDHAEDRYLSQMPAILLYLGRKHGLSVDAELEMRLACDANDILFEITRFHGAQMWDRESWQHFRDSRLPRWMQLHGRLLQDESAVGGDTPRLGDLILGALWHTMADRLPPLRPLLRTHAPHMLDHVDGQARRRALARMLQDWQNASGRYCGGEIEASLLDMLNGDTGQ